MLSKLDDGNILILDGGNGTELEKRGVPMEAGAWCGVAAVEHSVILENIHLDYLLSGADIITTNTFSTSRLMLSLSGYEDSFLEINKKTIAAAHRAKISSGKADILIAGSLSHRGMLTQGTASPDPNASVPISKLEESLTELALLLKEEGCDLIILEMMYDPIRMEATFAAAEKAGLPVWAGFSARQSTSSELVSFLPDRDIPLTTLYDILRRFNADAAGVMHTPANIIDNAVEVLKINYSGPIFSYPDSGYFKSPNWQFENIISEASLLQFARDWLKTGVQIFGGCCGLSPNHIKALSTLKQA